MKVELKNIKHAKFASRETACFEASIYIDGQRVGEVSNDGQGGPNLYHPWAIEKRLQEYAQTLPPLKSEFSDEPLPMDADLLIDELFSDWLEAREQAKLCKNKTVARLPGVTYGKGDWSVFKLPFSPEVKAKIIARYGEGVEFLNEKL